MAILKIYVSQRKKEENIKHAEISVANENNDNGRQ
jgi:hypothetical protein